MCYDCAVQLLSETFLILRKSETDVIKNVRISVVMYSTRYSCQILMKLEFSRRTFEKILNIILGRGRTFCLKYNNNNKIKYVLRLTKLCLFYYYY